jgi:DNA adenine methylase
MGGKYQLGPIIDKYAPPAETFIDVFGGGGNVIYSINPEKYLRLVYNDKDKNVYTLFKVLRSNEAWKLIDLLKLTPYGKNEFNEARSMLKKANLKDLDRAYYFYITLIFSKYNKLSCYSFGYHGYNEAKKHYNSVAKLPEKVEFLRKITLNNEDFRFFLLRFNEPYHFLYCDPPYPECVTNMSKAYIQKFTHEDHYDLLKLSSKSRAKIMISSYRNDFYDSILLKNGFEVIEYERHVNSSSGIEKAFSRTEALYINYDWEKEIGHWEATGEILTGRGIRLVNRKEKEKVNNKENKDKKRIKEKGFVETINKEIMEDNSNG